MLPLYANVLELFYGMVFRVVHHGTMTHTDWTLEHVAHVAGKRPVTVKRLVPSSVEWAQLEDAGTTTVGAFVASVLSQKKGTKDVTHQEQREQQEPGQQGHSQHQKQGQQDHEQRYLFDWSLPLFAPELDAELTVPCYFNAEVDMLKQMPEGSKYRDSWPSLFVAPEGLRSELHGGCSGPCFDIGAPHPRFNFGVLPSPFHANCF